MRVDELFERIKATGRLVDVIALNAGIGAGGAFVTDTVLPGPTETEFLERAAMMNMPVGQDAAAAVAERGFEALMAGKERAVVGSLSTRLQDRGSRFLPDRLKAGMHRQTAEPQADES